MPIPSIRLVDVKLHETIINCRVAGSETDPTLFFTGAIVFDDVLLSLADTLRMRVVVPGLPYWKAEEPEGFSPTIDDLVGDLILLSQDPTLIPVDSPFYIAGASLPGWLSIQLARHHEKNNNKNCKGLILIATPALPHGDDLKESNPFAAREKRVAFFQRAASPTGRRVGQTMDPSYQKYVQDLVEAAVPERKAVVGYWMGKRRLLSPAQMPDDEMLWGDARLSVHFITHVFGALWASAGEISLPESVPVLMVDGKQDLSSPTFWPEYLTANPHFNCQYAALDEVGHFPMFRIRSKTTIVEVPTTPEHKTAAGAGHLSHADALSAADTDSYSSAKEKQKRSMTVHAGGRGLGISSAAIRVSPARHSSTAAITSHDGRATLVVREPTVYKLGLYGREHKAPPYNPDFLTFVGNFVHETLKLGSVSDRVHAKTC